MPKIKISETYMTVEWEKGDPKKFREGWNGEQSGESALLYWLKGILNREPHNLDLIKKRMWKDGHMMDNEQQYLRTREIRKDRPYMMIWNGSYQIMGLDSYWNEDGEVTLLIERGIG